MNEIISRLEILTTQISDLFPYLKLPQKEQRILELEDQMQDEHFWKNNQEAQNLSQEHNSLSMFVAFWKNLHQQTIESLALAKQTNPEDADSVKFLQEQLEKLEGEYKKNRINALLSKEYDDHNAVIALHSGAGGADAQDWTEMLLRMYLRYCDKRGFKTEVLESHRGGEGGIKSVLVLVKGLFAYGYLKAEAGVHRLVRLSPFNPAHTRETSFALLEVLPELPETEHRALDPKDLKIETTTASGHGGQSVNTTYSAVRITHIPTGIKVSIQNERSQSQNKELALKILQARLQASEETKRVEEKKELRGEFKSAEWGNQIRSYTLHPYKLVKDHRTGLESTDPEEILDGNLDDFIEKYLETLLEK